ncbi:HAD family hydrolase [Variovorax saccharolyticus]|uniref:HAD family hydrolase n=1 Tax=Variovorax saccharolyticus TaxID=3053516 RepID=UPI002577CC98|nr:HAD family hydrolase [Variovorax sp. J31P216]MDM0028212.1 HAD family hydrolase [Variovorax sp. J31P216]
MKASGPSSIAARSLPATARRRVVAWMHGLALVTLWVLAPLARAQTDPLPSWHDGAAKQAIIAFVKDTTDKASPRFVDPEARIATFDQDGTTWVEQPNYAEAMFAFDRLAVELAKRPRLKLVEPFKTIMSGNQAAIAKLTNEDLLKVAAALTHSGLTVDEFRTIVADWLASAKHPRFKRPYTELVFQPMLEVMQYMRANGYKTYFATGGGQDFVREYAQKVYGIPPEQVIGSAAETSFGYAKDGKAVLTKTHKMLYVDDKTGKPIAIHQMIGRRPVAAFGNSVGDQQMLEYVQAGDGPRLMVLVHHDDAVREYAYGPASKVGTFSDALGAEAKRRGWVVISMKNDWKRIFGWE